MPDFKNTVGGRFLTMLEAQAPANFAMVMSTGMLVCLRRLKSANCAALSLSIQQAL